VSHYRPRHQSHRGRSLAIYLGLVLVLGGGFLVARAVTDGAQEPPAAAQLIPSTVSARPPAAPVAAGAPMPGSVPVKIAIPVLEVDAPVESVGLAADGTLQMPPLDNHNLAAWYDGSVTPGQKGASVIVGHVDSAAGTSVFFYIKNLVAGDEIDVTRADGSTATFTVDGVTKVPKVDFSAMSVYGSVSYPALRLVTCGGPFDTATGQYLDNIIVYAHLSQ
jgi:LPXTG-site transpeptidase (sortase) family protein